MSVATTIAVGVAVSAASLGAAKIQSNASNKSGQLQQHSADAALEFEKGRDARDYEQYQKEYERTTRIQDEDRAIGIDRFNKREGRLTPYRNFGESGLATLKPLLKAGPAGTSPLAPRRQPPASTIPQSA